MFKSIVGNKELKGIERELYFSKKIHSSNTPLLVSPLMLRKMGCGQIDIASLIFKGFKCIELKIYEVKTSGTIGAFQKKRLRLSGEFLSSILKVNSSFYII